MIVNSISGLSTPAQCQQSPYIPSTLNPAVRSVSSSYISDGLVRGNYFFSDHVFKHTRLVWFKRTFFKLSGFGSSEHLFSSLMFFIHLDIEVPSVLMLSFVLSLLGSPFSCLILSTFALFAKDWRVKWYWGKLLTHLLSTTTAAASRTWIIKHAAEWPKVKTPGQSHRIRCSGQTIFKLGSGLFWDIYPAHYHLLIIFEWILPFSIIDVEFRAPNPYQQEFIEKLITNT